MDDALVGVLIGGFIASIGSWISIRLQYKQWKIEHKVRILENKKSRLIELSKEILTEMSHNLIEESFDTDMISSMEMYFPESVIKIFHNFISKDNHDIIDKKHAYYALALEMKKVIKEVDSEIELLLS